MISIVLVNWNGWQDTISCMQSLLNSSSRAFRIIVVDNSSTDDSLDAFRRWGQRELELVHDGSDRLAHLAAEGADKPRRLVFCRYREAGHGFEGLDAVQEDPSIPSIYIVESGRNGGFGFGCNVGIRLGRELGSAAYWMLNNDCVVKPETAAVVAARIDERPDCIFGATLRYYSHPDRIQAIGGGFYNSVTSSVTTITAARQLPKLNFINGASMIFSDRCLADTGYFDERIFMYFEEIDFCLRAKAAGYSFDVIETDVFHKHGGSQGYVSSVGAWTNVLINRHYVSWKHLGWGPWIFFFCATLAIRAILPVGEKNARTGARRALKRLVLGS